VFIPPSGAPPLGVYSAFGRFYFYKALTQMGFIQPEVRPGRDKEALGKNNFKGHWLK